MFISEKELTDLQSSYLYKGLPLAYICFRELKRKGKFEINNFLEPFDLRNFFIRWDDTSLEVMFSDHSYLYFRLKDMKCYVIHARKGIYKEFPID